MNSILITYGLQESNKQKSYSIFLITTDHSQIPKKNC